MIRLFSQFNRPKGAEAGLVSKLCPPHHRPQVDCGSAQKRTAPSRLAPSQNLGITLPPARILESIFAPHRRTKSNTKHKQLKRYVYKNRKVNTPYTAHTMLTRPEASGLRNRAKIQKYVPSGPDNPILRPLLLPKDKYLLSLLRQPAPHTCRLS